MVLIVTIQLHLPLTLPCVIYLVLDRNDSKGIQKGKEAEIQKWEAEVRKNLANKKAGAPKLSKQEEALLQAQLEKERGIRNEVESLKHQLSEGLQIVHSLVDTQLEAFQSYISPVSGLLLDCALGRPAELLGTAPFDAFVVSMISIPGSYSHFIRNSGPVAKKDSYP